MIYKDSSREKVDTLEMKGMLAQVLKIAIRHYGIMQDDTLKGYIGEIKLHYDSL